jgi:hypothetical protein
VNAIALTQLQAWREVFDANGIGAGPLIDQALAHIQALEQAVAKLNQVVSHAGLDIAAPCAGSRLRPIEGGQLLNPDSASNLNGDVTVLIQGRLHPEGLKRVRDYQRLGPVLISCWDTCDKSLLEGLDLRQVTVVTSPVPLPEAAYNAQNMYFQSVSTLKGLEHVRTPFVIKIRCDEFWGDLLPVAQAARASQGRLVTTNVFFRKDKHYKFHISDHILAGRTPTLKATFTKMAEDCQAFRPVPHPQPGFAPVESLIAKAFLRAIGVVPDPVISRRQMQQHFMLVPVSELGEFAAVSNAHQKVFRTSQEVLAECHGIASLDDI